MTCPSNAPLIFCATALVEQRQVAPSALTDTDAALKDRLKASSAGIADLSPLGIRPRLGDARPGRVKGGFLDVRYRRGRWSTGFSARSKCSETTARNS